MFIYESAILPKNLDLLKEIDRSAFSLYQKLENLDVNKLAISDYNKVYFGSKIKNLRKTLQNATYILAWSLNEVIKPHQEATFVEYGAGSGINSLLAKEMGMNVIYNDIYDVSARDAQVIGKEIGITADHYVVGDIDDLLSFVNTNGIKCDMVASYDVIEHVYDINSFFSKLTMLSASSLNIVMGSGANPFHPYIRKKLMNQHIKFENQDREMEFGHKERDNLRAYKTLRKEIIIEQIGSFVHSHDLEILVENTRGMNVDDIKRVINDYLKERKLPTKPMHQTNTCDPITGNWAEHLMNPFEIVNDLESLGFKSKVLLGYYGNIDGTLKRTVGRMFDFIIKNNVLGSKSISLAPFYTIYAYRK